MTWLSLFVMVFAKVNKLDQRDARAISLETGIQNSGLGLILIFNFFNGLGGMAMIAAAGGLGTIVGPIFAGYLMLILVGMLYLAIGMLASPRSRSRASTPRCSSRRWVSEWRRHFATTCRR